LLVSRTNVRLYSADRTFSFGPIQQSALVPTIPVHTGRNSGAYFSAGLDFCFFCRVPTIPVYTGRNSGVKQKKKNFDLRCSHWRKSSAAGRPLDAVQFSRSLTGYKSITKHPASSNSPKSLPALSLKPPCCTRILCKVSAFTHRPLKSIVPLIEY